MTREEQYAVKFDQMIANDPEYNRVAREAAVQRKRYSETSYLEAGEQEEEVIESTSSSTTTTTTGNTNPGVFSAGIDYDYIRDTFLEVIGHMTIFHAKFIEKSITDGKLDTSAVIDALEQTSFAPRPSFPYFRAVLSRYVAEGIHSAEEAAQQRWARAIERADRNRDKEMRWYQEPNE